MGYLSRKNRKSRKRRLAEDQLRNDNKGAFIQKLLDTVANTIYIFDIEERRFVYVNEFSRQSLGYKPSEIKAFGDEFFYKIMDPDFVHLKSDHFNEILDLKDGEVKVTNTKLRHSDGSWRWFILKESVFDRNEFGGVKQVTGTITDVTEKKETEQQLKRSLNFIDKVMNSSPFDVFVYDVQEEKNIFVNDNVIKTLGYTAKEVQEMGVSFLTKVIYPGDQEVFNKNHAKLNDLAQNVTTTFELRVVASDGTVKWLNNQISVFSRDEQGRVKEIIGIARDITEKKEAEEYLRDNIHFINKITETIPNYIFVEDVVSDKLIFSNRSLLEDFGYVEKFEDPMNVFWKIIHPDDLPILTHIKSGLKYMGDEILKGEFRLRHADGSWRWVHTVLSAFKKNTSGEVIQVIASSLDITERKEAELKLQESQHFIQSILDTSPNSIYVYDLETRSNIYSTSSPGEDLGYPSDYIKGLGNNFMAVLLHPDDFEQNFKHWEELKTMKNGEVKSVEGRLKHADGNWRWYHLRHSVFKRNVKEQVVQVIGIATDITNLKKTEHQLEESKSFITKIMEANPNVVIIHEMKTKTPIYINRYVEEILGYTPEEILSMGEDAFKTLIHPDDQPKILKHLEEFSSVDYDTSKSIEYRARDKQGNWHWGLSKDSVFEKDSEGKVTKIIAAATEITDRKKIEEEIKRLNASLEEIVETRTRELRKNQERLKHRERQLRIITNSVPALISYLDTDLKYVFANNHYYKVFNIEGIINGKHITEVLGEENYNNISAMLKRAFAGEEVTFENNFNNKNNEKVYYKLSYIPDLDNKGELKGIIIMGSDLTDRYNYEKSLEERNVELVKINSELDNFIYTASHDLKSPIVNMEGLLKSLLEEANQQCKGDINEMLNFVALSVEKLKKTIEELSEISKIQKGTENYEERIEIEDIIKDFTVEYSEQIKSSQVKISTDLTVSSIKFSQKNFRSLFYNLLSNAIKFRSPERLPIISIRSEYTSNNYVKITISDNGMGFDMRKKDKVFGMFKRLHTHVEGTGVGMYIVKRIMENASGKIEVDSKEGIGTSFRLYFPIV
ncbi:multi-sensor hybrid histidine kinase [Sporocytophaga myxococcoides]|uniref:histidine kinase n=1 Tax=Sporocytophaga myxococcoides TaxID=153721 RepID=A0A098LC59_9BACT|nr:PAS domain S-box protein [Sporocytophaga myxococcoides]GAL84545.1 multi-sensor hybrid histidine kinase [Sporocytophaga myxococcoides]